MKICFVAVLVAIPSTIVNAGGASSLESAPSSTASIYGYTAAPIGHKMFCDARPYECVQSGDKNLRVKITHVSMKQLVVINENVNHEIKPVSDQEQYNEVERWIYPESGQGDCEDYVLLKKKRLVESRWPDSALLITVVKDEFGEGHAVLMVRTDRGDLILDNKRSEILPWHETGYAFIKRQSARDPQQWVSLLAPE